MQPTFQTALDLYDYTYGHHWNGTALVGPDPGVRWNRVLWRFVKSMFTFIRWNDDRYMLQCQGYWIRNNWTLYRLTGDQKYKDTAISATQQVLKQQQNEGFWIYPLPGWKGRIATVEGDYAALGLLATFRETRDESFLNGARKWYDYLIRETGFEVYEETKCIHYFAGKGRDMVPNNATLTLEFFGELFEAAPDKRFLEHADAMVAFLKLAQLDSGELPYSFDVPWAIGQTHFMCYQYNAFQFLDLVAFYSISPSETLRAILSKLIRYLKTGLHPDGHCRYACGKDYPEVSYYTAVLAAAFLKATEMRLGDYQKEYESAYSRILKRRQKYGNYIYSTKNYGLLRDGRSYPRYLSMILRHILMYVDHEAAKE